MLATEITLLLLTSGNSIIKFFNVFRCHAFKPAVVRRATIIAVIVGTMLVAINHGDRIYSGTFDWFCLMQAVLTMFVPYAVSTVSSVLAIEEGTPLSGKK